jgi:DNA-binding Lrp family transcriptional regulator
MDTTTVLEVIAGLDNYIKCYKKSKRPSTDIMVMSDLGAIKALENYRDHLQQYIEGQLNAEENNTVE